MPTVTMSPAPSGQKGQVLVLHQREGEDTYGYDSGAILLPRASRSRKSPAFRIDSLSTLILDDDEHTPVNLAGITDEDVQEARKLVGGDDPESKVKIYKVLAKMKASRQTAQKSVSVALPAVKPAIAEVPAQMEDTEDQMTKKEPAETFKVSPPDRKIIIDGGDAGQIEAYFHAVIRDPELKLLVLIYDTRYLGGQRWSPPARTTELTIDAGDGFKRWAWARIKYSLGDYENMVFLEADTEQSVPVFSVPND